MHTLEGGVRIQRSQLIKRGLNFLQSGFGLLLIPFIGRAMQIGYWIIQLFQRGYHLLACLSVQLAAVLFQRL
jgi:hypothetical protein